MKDECGRMKDEPADVARLADPKEQDLTRSSSFVDPTSSFPSSAPARPTWAEIDLDNLVHNLRVTRASLPSHCAIMAAVKADAYGHGAARCASVLEHGGVDWFGVALPEEGLELRLAGIERPILCLSGFWEGQEELIIRSRLTPAVFSAACLEPLSQAAQAHGLTLDYHLKVDTGMGRLGVTSSQLSCFLDAAERLNNLRMDGVLTHLASADEPEKAAFTAEQLGAFLAAVGMVRARGHKPRWLHAANGAAAHSLECIPGNMIRIGGLLYGLWRDVTDPRVPPLDWRPVMSLRTRIALIKEVPAGKPLGYGGTFVTERESLIATLPIGYQDGLRRALSNRGRVIVRGQFAPIVGRVSMDLALVDVTGIDRVGVGDEVVVLGQQGDRRIPAEEIAGEAGTLSYEVTCGISSRVPRVYKGPQNGLP